MSHSTFGDRQCYLPCQCGGFEAADTTIEDTLEALCG
jgi:hypothetical protein